LTQPKTWPQARQYQDAIQTPTICFSDPRLKAADIHVNSMGMPQAAAGKSAVVFKATAHGKDVAIRCFTRAASDQRQRYRKLHKHLVTPPWYMVGFVYRDEEILVANCRYPLVEMDWVDGDPLDVWVGKHLQRGSDLASQAAAWLVIVADMLNRGMAHGDIANDNCMVTGSQLKLVDYDGCYIEGLAEKNPGESGAQHFQHPGRSGYYAGDMDAFPDLVIYLSLLALQADPSLWRFHSDKNLIFEAADYKAPQRTEVWRELARSPDLRVRSLAGTLARMCTEPIAGLPSLLTVTASEGPWLDGVKQNGTKVAPPAPAPSLDWMKDHLKAQTPSTRPEQPAWAWPQASKPAQTPAPRITADQAPTKPMPARYVEQVAPQGVQRRSRMNGLVLAYVILAFIILGIVAGFLA
jgi:eukaryotic-like serine/threonine-protein kinase